MLGISISHFPFQIQRMIRTSLVKLTILLFILILLITFFIMPGRTDVIETRDKIEKLENKLDEHNLISPLYLEIKNRVKGLKSKVIKGKGVDTIYQNQIQGLTKRFEDLAYQNRMTPVYGVPDINTMNDNSKSLKYKLSVKGSYKNFRVMLKQISLLTYLEKIDRVSVKLTEKTDVRLIEMDLWIKLNEKKR